MRWDRLPINSTFEKARRKETYKRMAQLVRRRAPVGTLPTLEDVERKVRLFERTYVGIRAIPVASVTGTVGRPDDFDEDFLPRREELRQRWTKIERTYVEGDYPPIVAFKVGGHYFVQDGHHRVAVAKQNGTEMIDAEITELRPRFDIPDDADIGELIELEQHALFMEESGLDVTHPDADIWFTFPNGFVELLELVQVHGHHMMRERGEVIPVEDVARDWYENVYLPTVETIEQEGLNVAFPASTAADLFLWIYQRRRSMFPEFGSMSLEETVKLEKGSPDLKKKG